jgi:Fe-S cluster assembly protein SufD
MSMEGKLPIGEDRQALAEADRPAEPRSPARKEAAPGRREMNVAVLKTKAEQALTETFAAIADRLPGRAGVRKMRERAIGRFGTLGLPHRRIEAWKYTDLRNAIKEALPPAMEGTAVVKARDLDAALGPLAALDAVRVVFVDGVYSEVLSGLNGLEGIAGSPLAAALDDEGDEAAADLLRLDGRDDDAVLALNTAYAADGAVLGIAKNTKLDKPLLLVFARAGTDPRLVTTRNVVSIGDGAEATIIEAFVALPGAAQDGQHNAATEIAVGEGARVTHVKCTLEAGHATHLANWLVDIAGGADYRGFQFTSGVALARNQLAVAFKGEGAKLDLSAVFLGREHEHVDTTLVVDHAVPGCTSRELIKGVLEDEARGVFQGKVIVRPDAQKSDGKQMAQVLMLSPNAEFDSKPELEIYADDVVCGHGSTSADLDEDLLFYCRSRGIPLRQARALLIESFIGEAIAKVEREEVREALTALARRWLDRSAKRA